MIQNVRVRELLLGTKILVLTDIDGSMIGYDGSREGVREAVELLKMLGAIVIPVTAKTLDEISYLGEQLGFGEKGLISIVEMGGAVCATKGYLSLMNPLEFNGFECEVLGGLIEEFDEILDVTLRNCNAIRLSKASLSEAEEILGLRGVEALLATRRRFLEVIWSSDRECLVKASRRLEELGFNILMGRRFLHVGLHKGKGEAVLRLLDRLKPLLNGKVKVIGIGDSEADISFLELVDKPMIIPHDDPSYDIRLGRPDYVVAPYPAPRGWVWVAKQIALDLI